MTNDNNTSKEADALFLQNLISQSNEECENQEQMEHWSEKLSELIAKVDALNKKIDSIDAYTDRVVEDTPDKFAMAASVSKDSFQSMQNMFDQLVQRMTEIHLQQMKQMADLHSKQMKEQNDRIDSDTRQQYERGNAHRREVNRMLHDADGLYLHGIWSWIAGTFFWIGVITVIAFISIEVYKLFEL